MIVVQCLELFALESTGVLKGWPVLVDPGSMIGYLPVYATLEAARKDYPDTPILEIEKEQP